MIHGTWRFALFKSTLLLSLDTVPHSQATSADSYDIYLDDTLVINVPSPEWTPSPAIISGTHTWRVVARYGASRLGSADSTFTVLAPASV
jgi:hypothetical protein